MYWSSPTVFRQTDSLPGARNENVLDVQTARNDLVAFPLRFARAGAGVFLTDGARSTIASGSR